MKIHIADLTNQQINFLVAGLEGYKYIHTCQHQVMVSNKKNSSYDFDPCGRLADAIIERERICIYDRNGDHWGAHVASLDQAAYGATAAVAAMRAYILAKIGPLVDDTDFPVDIRPV